MPSRRPLLPILLLALALGAPAFAQSLAEVARKAAESRTETKAPAKTYTNGNLTPDFTTPAAPAAPAAPVAPVAPEAPAASVAPATPAAEPLDEAYWRRYAKAVNGRVEAARKALAAAPNPATDTPQELARVEQYVAKAKASLASAEEAYREFLMQAEIAKVPKAWLQ